MVNQITLAIPQLNIQLTFNTGVSTQLIAAFFEAIAQVTDSGVIPVTYKINPKTGKNCSLFDVCFTSLTFDFVFEIDFKGLPRELEDALNLIAHHSFNARVTSDSDYCRILFTERKNHESPTLRPSPRPRHQWRNP